MARQRLGLSQEAFTQALATLGYNEGKPVSQMAVSRWESGQSAVPEAVLDLLPGLTGGLEEREGAMAQAIAAAAWAAAAETLKGADPVREWGQTPEQVLIIRDTTLSDLSDLVPAAVLRGIPVAVDSDAPAAEALRQLLAQLPEDQTGPYAIGRAEVARFLQEYPAVRQVPITDRGQLLALVGLEEHTLAPAVAEALERTREFLARTAPLSA